ncbi:FMN-dependent NADH-azoreductase [Glaciimonas immobilis]|uniref:FMN dependent NADH:quinone oxidoreductase n=1 Tax=Glaciimonas immobilis TaxID=728004 RepID=A0A840RRZ9_9BURK|nr:NAD(P)H-dependent oxidoreductase [Glaciimonas immobilis]KAF3998053.1 FMN-dependent NADH-azoreductase [Glaciimonas immobilis]MBB5199259.1 FMN-dependent NADH-azoreductase [Glaciimonas immobilis]
MKLLHIDSSILGDASASRALTREVVANLKADEPNVEVVYRDLSLDVTTHLSGSTFVAKGTAADQRSAAQTQEIALGEAILNEFMAADVIVVGAPMYNFTVPTQLKAWIDQICVAGVTFRYSETGPEGLAKGKRVIIVLTSGGKHVGAPSGVAHEDYLKVVFGFLGITDIEVVRAEGLNYGAEAKEAGFAAARVNISALKTAVAVA